VAPSEEDTRGPPRLGAEDAHCARSTVAEAIKALEDAGVLSWVQRIKRVRVRCPDLFGDEGVRVVPQRTSNAYHFKDPGGAGATADLNKKFASAPKSEKPTGTPNQVLFFFGPGAVERSSSAVRGLHQAASRPSRRPLARVGGSGRPFSPSIRE
jgi:hypothetical protein